MNPRVFSYLIKETPQKLPDSYSLMFFECSNLFDHYDFNEINSTPREISSFIYQFL